MLKETTSRVSKLTMEESRDTLAEELEMLVDAWSPMMEAIDALVGSFQMGGDLQDASNAHALVVKQLQRLEKANMGLGIASQDLYSCL